MELGIPSGEALNMTLKAPPALWRRVSKRIEVFSETHRLVGSCLLKTFVA